MLCARPFRAAAASVKTAILSFEFSVINLKLKTQNLKLLPVPTFLLAPDSLKGSLSAVAACAAMERGVRRALPKSTPEFLHVPLADGGEGTVEALLRGAGGTRQTARVHNPLGEEAIANWAILHDGRAILEMAQASGLTLISSEKRDALRASSYGTGELICAALDAGCREILLGIGGSAITDGGSGALSALGIQIFDSHGNEIAAGGAALQDLARIDFSNLDSRLCETHFRILCDVTNPLCGANGAAQVYAPQKGASPADVEILDAALSHFADVVAQTVGCDLRDVEGAGAAGGIGFGLLSFLNADLISGIEEILDATDFSAKLERADFVFTAEGAIDAQTLRGKALSGIAHAAKKAKNGHGVPVIAFGGGVKLSGEELAKMGIVAALPLPDAPQTLQDCVARADDLLSDAAERATRLLLNEK